MLDPLSLVPDADEQTFVAFDLETTGLSSRVDRIIEIGAVKFRASGVVDTLSTLVDPGMPVPLVVQRLCGLHDSDLRGQPSPEEAVGTLALFAEGCTLVGHGVSFDLAFCADILPEVFAKRDAIDTSELARTLIPLAPSHSLQELSISLGLLHDRPHRALSDADATRLLLGHLTLVAQGLPQPLRARLGELLRGGGWFSGEFLAKAMAEAPPLGSLGQIETAAPPLPIRPPVPVPEDPLTVPWVAEQFGPDGVLSQAGGDFELREEQQQMAVAVTQALRREQRLLVEAGTGVGKSFAYLLPAREWAARTGERVVISTHTITLQEQLASRDLPALEALRPLPVRTAVLKGRANYISLRRLERWLVTAPPASRRPDVDELRFKVRILIWAQQTKTGDRSELRLAGRDGEFWEQVASTTDDCLGPACLNWSGGGCFMVKARAAAREAGVVIVNHALLLSGSDGGGSVLPEFRRLVIDEAHHLEESAIQSQGRRLALASVLAVIERLPDFGDAAVRKRLQAARLASQAAFGELKVLAREGAQRSGAPPSAALVLDQRALALEGWGRCQTLLLRFTESLGLASASLRRAAVEGMLQGALWPQPDNAGRECRLAAESLESMAAMVADVVGGAEGGAGASNDLPELAWVEIERGDRPVLRTAPSDISQLLEERLFGQCDTVVLTSATLSINGSFAYIRERLGLADAEELILDSPFDYLKQALCCLPVGMPGHDAPGHAQVMADMAAEIAMEIDGRTLILFTGYQALREFHTLLRARLHPKGIAVLAQGMDGTRNQLLRNFRNNSRTVLLGTNSFWEGIDLPGESLQCVIIDKLPFPVPSDPIYQARARGSRDAFAAIALPEAVLRLKQGFGRLVRRHGDRGAVVICDPRIVDRSYGAEFVRALPKATFVYEPPSQLAPVLGRFIRGGR